MRAPHLLSVAAASDSACCNGPGYAVDVTIITIPRTSSERNILTILHEVRLLVASLWFCGSDYVEVIFVLVPLVGIIAAHVANERIGQLSLSHVINRAIY